MSATVSDGHDAVLPLPALLKCWAFADRTSACAELHSGGAGSAVTSVAWHPYKALIATGSKDTSVRLWDPSTGKVITSL